MVFLDGILFLILFYYVGSLSRIVAYLIMYTTLKTSPNIVYFNHYNV